MDERYRIHDLTPSDVDAAEALLQLAAEKQPAGVRAAKKMLLELMAAGNSVLNDCRLALVAEDATTGQIVGATTAGITGLWSHPVLNRLPDAYRPQWLERIGELHEVAVHPEHRRRGIGTQLLQHACAHRVAHRWRLLLWSFHADSPDAAFHPAPAMWPVGQEFRLSELYGQIAMPVRKLTGDLRLCTAALHPAVKYLHNPDSDQREVTGVFTGPPGEVHDGRAAVIAAGEHDDRPRPGQRHRKPPMGQVWLAVPPPVGTAGTAMTSYLALENGASEIELAR
ncbi:GNAT family N-acetyltransferase [Streptomyces goshikiensis]|uniref:GNAT family N-acetyltransferase n=1 Tax=Streptomyces goshikiensis TaxID=1942 RepID=UPI00365412D6